MNFVRDWLSDIKTPNDCVLAGKLQVCKGKWLSEGTKVKLGSKSGSKMVAIGFLQPVEPIRSTYRGGCVSGPSEKITKSIASPRSPRECRKSQSFLKECKGKSPSSS